MIDVPSPSPLINPLARGGDLDFWTLMSGPLGVVLFIPFIPLVRLAARRAPRAALIGAGLAWLLLTAGPGPTFMLLLFLAAGVSWLLILRDGRRRGALGPREAVAAVWIGLHVLILPLWWHPRQDWFASPMPALHALGFAYLAIRLISWGVQIAYRPNEPLRLLDSICWLLYVPCMRNGPVMLRDSFLERFAAWRDRMFSSRGWFSPVPASSLSAVGHAAAPASAVRAPLWSYWRAVLPRLAGGVVAAFFLGVIVHNLPRGRDDGLDFFSAPQNYATRHLSRVFYLVPIAIYLFMWAYNEFAAGAAAALGLRVDDNFNHLPRAVSVRDFWRRWHITMGRWLRDFVYIPLGGKYGFAGLGRGSAPLNTLAVFAYCAVWHGASVSFLVWAVTQVAALAVQQAWDAFWAWCGPHRRPRGPAWTILCWLLTMHYQIATILVFMDFEHCGSRILPELLRRCWTPAS